VEAVAVLPDRKRALSASQDMTLKLWDLEAGAVVSTFYHDAELSCLSVTHDLCVIAGDILGTVCVLKIE
jgi:WD40 repeat protein